MYSQYASMSLTHLAFFHNLFEQEPAKASFENPHGIQYPILPVQWLLKANYKFGSSSLGSLTDQSHSLIPFKSVELLLVHLRLLGLFTSIIPDIWIPSRFQMW